jgi:tetratricopeptide (TPR) repeat protein
MPNRPSSSRVDKVSSTLADAAVAHRKGDAVTAKRLYRKVLRARPGHFKALRLSGALAHESGDLDEAIRLLSAAVRHAPANETGALEDLGLLHLQTGEHDKAEALLRKALTINGASLVALTRLGSTLLTCGRGAEAVEVLGRARAIAPGNVQLAYAMAHALLEIRDFEAAVGAADAGLEISPEDPGTLIVRGVALHQLERYDEAVATLSKAVAAAPDDVNGWLHLGKARLGAGDAAGAIAALEKAVECAPGSAAARGELANAHNSLGETEQAIAACDRYLAEHPAAAMPMLLKSLALRDSGDSAAADRWLGLDRLVGAEPIDAPPRYDSVDAFNAALERVVRTHPSLARVHTDRATRGGIQTGSLMIDPTPELRAFERIVSARIRELRQSLRDAGLAEHPWLQHAPARWFVNAWGLVLGEGAHQVAHLRSEAWLSGLYVVRAPGADAAEGGWIELGSLPDQLRARAAPPTRRIDPTPGLLLSYPSFIPQRIVPVIGPDECVLIAFDVFATPG